MVRARQVRSAVLLACLGGLVVVVAVLGVRAVVDVAQGLGVLGGEDVEAGPPPGVDGDAQPALVDRVVDGDTIRVRVEEPGGAIPPTDSVGVRLLNVDAPELDHPERGRDCGASEAATFVEGLAPPGTLVWLSADTEDRDHYDRPLRAVFTEDGRFVNAELTRAGWAEAVLFEPNDRFHGRMVELEGEARTQRRGVWALCDGFP